MGNEINKVELKYDVVRSNNQAGGLNADGSKPTYGLADTTFEKGAYAFGVAMPIWQYKGKIGEAWKNRSWQNFGNAYKQGWHNAGQTLRHPMNYWDLEFVNSKVSKLEGIMSSHTPKMPKRARFDAATQELFKNLCKAKNPREFQQLIGQKGSDTYKQFRKLLKHLPSEEAAKLRNVARYNEMYGELLKDFKTAQTQLKAGNLGNGRIASLHRRFANARLAENRFIQSAKKGANIGLKAKTGAKMSKGVKSAMAASKTLRTASRGVGKLGGALLIGLSSLTAGLDIYSAVAASPKGEGVKNGFKQAGKSAVRLGCEVGAMAVGQWAGAAIGQVLIPIPGVGAAIGGFLGSMLGGFVGSKIADKIPYTQKTVAEELAEDERTEQNKLVSEAIENDDIETVNNYTAQFKEQVLDEQGQPMADENGNPLYKIVQVSEDEKEQKEFEQRVMNLDNYVMTEAAKREEAERLKAEAEEAALRRQQQMDFGGSLYYGNSYAPAGYVPAETTPAATGYGPAGTAPEQTTYGFGVNGNSQFGSFTTDWRNPAWQNSLANQYNSSNFYAFNPNNYTPLWATNGKNFYAPAA